MTYDAEYDNDEIDDPDTYDDNVMHGGGWWCELNSFDRVRGPKGVPGFKKGFELQYS